METEEVLNQLFQNTNNGKLTHLDQVTPLGRQIGVAFIALLMQDTKGRMDTRQVVRFIKSCGYFSKVYTEYLKEFVPTFWMRGLKLENRSFAQAFITSDNGTLTNLLELTTIGRSYGYVFLSCLKKV